MNGRDSPASSGPFASIGVLDVTNVLMGPYATQLLADMGADIIMLEPREGMSSRRMGPGPHPESASEQALGYSPTLSAPLYLHTRSNSAT